MIVQGDGTLARRIRDGLCPQCESLLTRTNDQEEIKCKTCGLVMGTTQTLGGKKT